MTLQSKNQNTLESLCSLIVNTIHPKNVDGSSYIGLEHISSGKIFSDTSGYAEDVQSHKYVFQKNDVLYSKLRPYLDKAVLTTTDGICTTELLVLRPHKGVSSLFLVCMLHDKNFIQYAMEGVTGVQHPRTSWAHIKNYKIEKFSIEVYHKIGLLGATVQHALSFNEGLLNLAKKFKHATMHKLFTCGLRGEAQKETEIGLVPESWKILALNEVALVQTGVAKGRKFKNEELIEVPYIRVANVQDGSLDLAQMKTIRIRPTELDRYLLQEGDVLLTEGGDFDKLGRGFIWRGEIAGCIHQNHVFAVRVDRNILLPEYFAYLAQSPYGKSYFLKVAHKTTNLACINTTKLKAFPVAFPGYTEQHEIVAILDAIDQKIDLHRRKKAVLEELFKSLLHKLMTGEIRVDELDLSALEALQQPGGAA